MATLLVITVLLPLLGSLVLILAPRLDRIAARKHRSGLHAGHDGIQPDPAGLLPDRRAGSAVRLRAPGRGLTACAG